jgi:hypothetical protein
MVGLTGIVVEVFQGIDSSFGRSRTDIVQIEPKVEWRQQRDRILRTQTK